MEMLHISYIEKEQMFRCHFFEQNWLGTHFIGKIGKHVAIPLVVKQHQSVDRFGSYSGWEVLYQSPVNPDRRFTGTIKKYDTFVIFETINHYAIRGKENKYLFGFPYIAFPCFVGSEWKDDLSILTFKRQVPFNYPEQWHGRVVDSLREGRNIPVIACNASYETLVLSPLTHLLHGTVSIRHNPPELSCGIPRAVTIVPDGTHSETLMVAGVGVNKTLEHWGNILSTYHRASPVDSDADISLTHLSYWTNAGSAYWYRTIKNMNYEETLKQLKAHHQNIGLHFGSYQLDSWWYKREHEGYTGGILAWEPRSEALRINYNTLLPFWKKKPRSLPLFSEDRLSIAQEVLQTPIGCHFKQLSNHSVYVQKNPEQFSCKEYALPIDRTFAAELFQEIFTHTRWRLSYIVHDWLQWMNDHHSGFLEIETGEGYFQALDEALLSTPASDNLCGHLTAQLCMTQPHMTLNSVTMKAVTSIRSTSDSRSFFVEGPRRWRWHLYSSRFIEVLGKYAFYDNRKSSRPFFFLTARIKKLEMIWLNLSCGPIGLGDRIGKENLSVIVPMICIDGVIIKPDAPAKPLDQCFLFNPTDKSNKNTVTLFTETLVPLSSYDNQKGYVVLYLLSMNMHTNIKKTTTAFKLTETTVESSDVYALYNTDTGNTEIVANATSLHFSIAPKNFTYHIASPVIDGIAFFGDLSKYVSAGKNLIQEMVISKSHWKITGSFSGNANSKWGLYSEKRIVVALLNNTPLQIKKKGETTLLSHEPGTMLPCGSTYQLDLFFENKSGSQDETSSNTL